ncbi:MAG: mandelate racemase/muconate lactonizing enzyme family protein [Alcaligenaceae bacterium]
MTKIRDIRIIGLEASLPESQAYGMARGLTSKRGCSLIFVETDSGITGIGEAWGPPKVCAAYLDIIRPYFIDQSLYAQRGVQQLILAKNYHLGTQNQMIALFSGIDIASHDAIGKGLGVSVCDLIGGRQRTQVPVYASGGYFTLEADQQAALARQLEPHANSGFPAFKIKIGRHPAEDVERVKLARSIIGDQAVLTVDGNGNYTVDQALESMRRIAPYNIGWYEEPLAPQDWRGYAELKQKAPIPLATGEALYETFDFRRLVEERLVDVLQPDLSLAGGLSVARFIGELCSSAHLRVSPHVWGGPVGLAAAVHWVASLSNYPHSSNDPTPTLVEYDIGKNPLKERLLREPLLAINGYVTVPQGMGLGIDIDPDALAEFRIT